MSAVGSRIRSVAVEQRAPARVRILLADRQSLFRDAVRSVLQAEADLQVVAEASDGVQAVAEAERTRPDVVVLDANLPNGDGLRTAAIFKERVRDCRVLLINSEPDEEALGDAIEVGASGFLARTSPISELIEAVRALHRGETAIPPLMLGPLLVRLTRRRREQDQAMRLAVRLTRREREVLVLLAGGADNEAIAQALVISPQTARTHVQNVLSKLGVHSRLEAASFVLRHGLLDELRDAEPARA